MNAERGQGLLEIILIIGAVILALVVVGVPLAQSHNLQAQADLALAQADLATSEALAQIARDNNDFILRLLEKYERLNFWDRNLPWVALVEVLLVALAVVVLLVLRERRRMLELEMAVRRPIEIRYVEPLDAIAQTGITPVAGVAGCERYRREPAASAPVRR